MINILDAINNIIANTNRTTSDSNTISRNRANSMGGALEKYMKDAFSGAFLVNNEEERLRLYNQEFSWLGNQNNPPDFIIRGGDAVEVKKIQSPNSDLALNSSYPKAKLYSTSSMITQGCRVCEDWSEKDIIYAVGHTSDDELKSLWMVYGNIYAANQEIYERIKTTISTGIRGITDVEFAETNELGRVNRVDPLGITNLRIRGMWSIQNPNRVFNRFAAQINRTFSLVAIIPLDKYLSFSEDSRTQLELMNVEGLSIEDSQVQNPNNPANLVDVKIIKYIID